MINIKISDKIRIRREEIPEHIFQKLHERLTFPNPKFEENIKYGRSNWDTEELLSYLHKEGEYIEIPRGFANKLKEIITDNFGEYKVASHLRDLPDVSFTFNGKLHDYQQRAVDDILAKDFGVLQAPTGSGKTTISLYVAAQRKQPTLIVVHTKELLNQWKDRIVQFLEIPKNEIGIIDNGKKTLGKKITVATVQSLSKCVDEVKGSTWFLITDECHRTPSRTFTDVVQAFDCQYTLGLTATPYRRDKLTRLIYFYMGDRVHTIDTAKLQESNHIMRPTLRIRKTSCTYFYDDNYALLINDITTDYGRNSQIVSDVMVQVKNETSGIALVISERRSHCQILFGMLRNHGVEARLPTGATRSSERQQIVDDLNSGNVKVLISTAQLIGEDFDCRHLTSIFLTMPIKSSGKLIQCIGRVLRTAPGKEAATIYDWAGSKIGVLSTSFQSRLRVYKKCGIAIPGNLKQRKPKLTHGRREKKEIALLRVTTNL